MRRRTKIICAAIIAIAVIVAVPSALLASGGTTAVAAGAATAATPEPLMPLTQNGVSAATMQQRFVLQSGAVVSTAAGNGLRCVVLTNDGSEVGNGNCASPATIESGNDVFEIDHCTNAGTGIRRVLGLAPSGVASAILERTDGSTEQSAVIGGAFAFEQELGPTAVAATTIRWLSSAGQRVGGGALPSGTSATCLHVEGSK
ncbi:MAG: hypothetical protein ACLQBY_00770 [Solirubrobacteraceae bacterium]